MCVYNKMQPAHARNTCRISTFMHVHTRTLYIYIHTHASLASQDSGDMPVHPPPNIARDLVAPGTIIHLRQMAATGEYTAVSTDYTDPEMSRIVVNNK
jgi:hypothetical protein